MSRVYVWVEGHTEEAFFRELLVPHYARSGCYLQPIIVSTSPRYKGGVVSYGKVRPQIIQLCRQDATAYVSTMFDLYALPKDFPGKGLPTYPHNATGHLKALFLEAQLALDIAQPNFLANLVVHEYEALLFTQPNSFSQWSDDTTLVSTLQQALTQAGAPEDINDSLQTAPSKRIFAAMPSYQKTFHGPLIACDIGLNAMRQACPHFHAWLLAIEKLTLNQS